MCLKRVTAKVLWKDVGCLFRLGRNGSARMLSQGVDRFHDRLPLHKCLERQSLAAPERVGRVHTHFWQRSSTAFQDHFHTLHLHISISRSVWKMTLPQHLWVRLMLEILSIYAGIQSPCVFSHSDCLNWWTVCSFSNWKTITRCNHGKIPYFVNLLVFTHYEYQLVPASSMSGTDSSKSQPFSQTILLFPGLQETFSRSGKAYFKLYTL